MMLSINLCEEKLLRLIGEFKNSSQTIQKLQKENQQQLILLTTTQVVRITGLSRKTIYNYRVKYGMPWIQIGGSIRFCQKELTKYFRSKGINFSVDLDIDNTTKLPSYE